MFLVFITISLFWRPLWKLPGHRWLMYSTLSKVFFLSYLTWPKPEKAHEKPVVPRPEGSSLLNDRFSNSFISFITCNLGIQLFYMPEAWKVYPFWVEPPCIGHYREYSPTSEIFSAIRSKTFGTRCKPAMDITKRQQQTIRLLKQSLSSSSLVFFQSSVKPFFVGFIVYDHKSRSGG